MNAHDFLCSNTSSRIFETLLIRSNDDMAHMVAL